MKRTHTTHTYKIPRFECQNAAIFSGFINAVYSNKEASIHRYTIWIHGNNQRWAATWFWLFTFSNVQKNRMQKSYYQTDDLMCDYSQRATHNYKCLQLVEFEICKQCESAYTHTTPTRLHVPIWSVVARLLSLRIDITCVCVCSPHSSTEDQLSTHESNITTFISSGCGTVILTREFTFSQFKVTFEKLSTKISIWNVCMYLSFSHTNPKFHMNAL